MRTALLALTALGFSLLPVAVAGDTEKEDKLPTPAEIRVSLRLIAIEVEKLQAEYTRASRSELEAQGQILDGEAPGDRNLVQTKIRLQREEREMARVKKRLIELETQREKLTAALAKQSPKDVPIESTNRTEKLLEQILKRLENIDKRLEKRDR
jgi:adenylate kinase family enzyme